jgi:hypothetical protein
MDTIMTKSLALLAALAALSAPAFADSYGSKSSNYGSQGSYAQRGGCAADFIRKHGLAAPLNVINSERDCIRELQRLDDGNRNNQGGLQRGVN